MFTKNFRLCFSKIKCLPTPFSEPPPTLGEEQEDEEEVGGGEETNHQPSLSSSTTSLTMMKSSFNSVYDLSSSSSTCTSDDFFSPSSNNSEPDFTTVFSSPRFFVSSPGRSNSILDSSSDTNPDTGRAETTVAVAGGGGVAIRKYSPDPYADFRKSMQEMIEATGNGSRSRDWEYLHELLLCYLNLNPQPAHRFIICAFTDLLVSLLSSSDESLQI